jgi:hypothetical protein
MNWFPLIPILAETTLSDIREIAPQPNPWPWISLALLLLLTALFFFWKRRRAQRKEPMAAPAETPDAKALRLLDRLRQQDDQLDAEAFMVAVSSILRNYLEEALNLPAPEQTSEEFLQELRGQTWLTPELQQKLEDFMRLGDLVKFARQPLHADQRKRLLESASLVVEATRPQPKPVAS